MDKRAKGYLMLTEARSGSNWLGSLANSTGQIGNLEEWLRPDFLGDDMKNLTRAAFLERVFQKASTGNGRFAIKLFPWHIHAAQHYYGFDFIAEISKHRDVSLIFLRRQDRHRQAISLARTRMNGLWRSTSSAKRREAYDFDLICRSYFDIENSYAFWSGYLGLRSLNHHEYDYETLTHDPQPYISRLSELLEVDLAEPPQTNLRVQRDALTEEWLDRFRSDATTQNVLNPAHIYSPASRTLGNFGRFLRRKPMTPYPWQ